MNRRRVLRAAITVVGAFAAALVPLLLLDGDRRALGFRVYGIALGALALRAIVGYTAESETAPPDSPFHRRRGLRTRRHRADPDATARRRTTNDHLASGAVSQASAFHFRLRPVLRAAADERLRAHHGIALDDPRSAAVLGPAAADLLRHDRPAPHDRRGPGVDEAALADLLTTLERLAP